MRDILPKLPSILSQNEPKKLIFNKGEAIVNQFYKAQDLFLLLDGSVKFEYYSESERDTFQLGSSDLLYTPIGWSGLNEPHRYSTTVLVESETVEVLRWEIEELIQYCNSNSDLTEEFFSFIIQNASEIFSRTLNLYYETAKSFLIKHKTNQKSELKFADDITHISNSFDYIRRSPFFAVFEDDLVNQVASQTQRLELQPGNFLEDHFAEKNGLFILEEGWIDLICRSQEENDQYIFRSISTSGFVVGWHGLINLPLQYTISAKKMSYVLFIEKDDLYKIFKSHGIHSVTLFQRILWLLAHNLQNVRVKLISLLKDHELTAVVNLIDQNSTKLRLESPLHKVPHLLSKIQTIEDGLNLLHDLHDSADHQEKVVSSLILDNLEETEMESNLYQGLIETYNTVSKSSLDPIELRKICSQKFINAFENVHFKISGLENLPDKSGHIFIYNHLKNHPYYTLPNNFQITLDSHFISSFILYKHYDDPGTRIVRIGRGSEFGHQNYYEKLGHINVFTAESGNNDDNQKLKEEIRKNFTASATGILNEGRNILISPEGTSYSTAESPGPFKSGIFHLVKELKVEPYIVPISMAFFDKRARNNIYKCQVNPPFKLSEKIGSNQSKEDLKKFAKDLQIQYSEYVKSTIEL